MPAAPPASVLKKRARAAKWDQEAKAHADAHAKKLNANKQTAFTRAEQYVKEFREQEDSLVQLKRAAKLKNTFYVPPEKKLLFVMRLRGIMGMHPKTRHIMQTLRLLQINNGIFLRANQATLNMLVKVDPYIMYGYPSRKTVSDLVYKRGFAKINGQRVPLTDNTIVEKALSEQTKGEVICIEDLIQQIFTAGPHFKACAKFLWPFKMNSPSGGFSRIRNHFVEGGDAGNREEYINELVHRMI